MALPPELELCSTVPAADLGAWVPRLITIDRVALLALSRDFHDVRAFGTTWAGDHVMIFAPSTDPTVALVNAAVSAPPRGLDHHGPTQ